MINPYPNGLFIQTMYSSSSLNKDVKFFIVIYVDDFILMCNDQNKFMQVKEEHCWKFEMKLHIGDYNFFLSMEVERNWTK
jgi:hypothetical protein